jgi:uncharacterized delta-60 repeat protein
VTGAPDSFNPDATVSSFYSVNAIAVQPDGKILAGGFFGPNMGGQTRFFMARLDPNTGAADSFNPSPNLSIFSIVLQADGKILIGGPFTQLSPNGGAPVTRNRLARLNPDGTLDTAFNPNASGSVYSIATQADGKILAGGEFTTLAPNGGGAVTRNRIARLETDGRLDRTLDLGLVGDSVLAAAVQPDGKILIGGLFSSVSGTARSNIARLNPDGTLDTAFNPNANGRVNSIALQADGKILVGGQFTTIGGALRNRIARVDATTGAADLSFNPNASGPDPTTVFTIAVQADGKILVGGRFIAIGGEARTNIARLDATTGSADSTFNPITNGSVVSIALQADGRILVAGAFTNIAGQPRNRIARLNPDGSADSFDPNANASVLALAVQGDGHILVGGDFTNIGGQPRNRVARLDPDGSADSFDPNANAPVFSLAVQADGRVLVGGDFLNIGGVIRGRIARLTPNGLVETFNPTANGSVYSLALQADGKVLVGGGFGQMGTDSRNAFARLSNDTSALQNLSATQTSVTWTRGGSSPQLARVTFEYSADNANYTLLGSGTAAGSHWGLTGLNLPLAQNIYIRARGYHRSGLSNASESITESARNAFIATADPTPTPTPTATPTATPGLVANVSTRLPVGTDDNVLIEGFIVLGPNGSTKKIMVRALGPFLIPFGIPDALPNPTLEIRDASNGLIASNNDWRNTQVGGIIAVDQAAEIEGSGLAPVNDLESAIIAELSPGGYTAIVRGVNNTVGTGIVDAYDMSPGSPARLANVATRGLIQPGDQLMIAGFIIQQGDVRAVVRAIGPSLSAFGITNALPDTTLQLRDVNGAIVRENDDWQSDQKVELENTGLQPGDSREAAVVVTLPPGQYTAQVRGKPETTGIGVVEVYFLQ